MHAKELSGSSSPTKHAPWFGSFWEQLIDLTKSTINETLGRMHTTLESLQITIVEA